MFCVRQKKHKRRSGETLTISSKDSWKDRFRKARMQVGLNQADVAYLLGVTRATISFWEAGINFPAKKRYSEINAILQKNIFSEGTEVVEPAFVPEHIVFMKKFRAAPVDIRRKIMALLRSVEAK